MLTSDSILEAINLINPAYNPDGAFHYFPQPVLHPQPVIFGASGGDSGGGGDGDIQSLAECNVTPSDESSMAPSRLNVVCGNLIANQPDQTVMQNRKKGSETRCEIYSISCNSKKVFDTHLLGRKHINKMKANYPDILMVEDPLKAKPVDIAEPNKVKNMVRSSLPGPKEINKHNTLVEETDTVTSVLELSGFHPSEVSEINRPKQLQSSTPPAVSAVSGISCNSKEMLNGHMEGNKHTSQVKEVDPDSSMQEASSADPVEVICISTNLLEDSTSGTSLHHCSTCNIFSNSRASLEMYLAGEKHALKLKDHALEMKNDDTLVSLAANVDHVVQSSKLKTVDHGTASNAPVVWVQDSSQDGAESNGTSSTKLTVVQKSGSFCPGGAGPNDFIIVNHPYYVSDASQKSPERSKTVLQFAFCAICKIHCTSSELLIAHQLGKKHQRELKKLGRPYEDIIVNSDESSKAPSRLNVVCGNLIANQSDQTVMQNRKKGSETRCEICSISCNSKKVFDTHLLGRKHINKMKANYPDTLMVEDPLKAKPVDIAEPNKVKNMVRSSLPGPKEINKHNMLVEETDTVTSMLELSGFHPSEVSEINRPKQLQSSTPPAVSVVSGISRNSKEMLNGHMECNMKTSLLQGRTQQFN